jgi:hypothetical protein
MTTLRPKWVVAFAVALCISSSPRVSAAQGQDSLTRLITYALPTAPAIALIGGSTEGIARPTTPKDLATTMTNAVDASGRVMQGVALEFGRTVLARNVDRETYLSPLGFVRANTALSLGTARVAGDSASTNLGIGVRVLLLNRSDPLVRDGSKEALASLQRCLDAYDPNSPEPVRQQQPVRDCYASVATADSVAQLKWILDHWNAWSVGVAYAYAAHLGNSEFGNRTPFGWSASAVVAAPLCLSEARTAALCRHGQLLLQLAHDSRDSLSATEAGSSRSVLGARLNIGTARIGFFAELLAARYGASSGSHASKSEWSGGLEWRVNDDLWASTGLGTRYDLAVATEKVVVFAGLRFNTFSTRKFVACNAGSGSPAQCN